MNPDTSGFQRHTWRAKSKTTPPSSPPSELVSARGGVPSDSVRVPLMWLIVARPAANRGTVLPIQSGQTLGRSGDIRWADPRLSRQHARFTLEMDSGISPGLYYVVTPLQDRSATLLNGKQLAGPTTLKENDSLQMGDTVFVVKMLD